MNLISKINPIFQNDMQFVAHLFSKPLPDFIQKYHYFKLINWVYQHTDHLLFKNQSQFKTKFIIDLFLSRCQFLDVAQYQLLGISAIILSFKIFEQQKYPYNYAVINTGQIYSQQQIREYQSKLQNQVSTYLNKLITPFDYFEIFELYIQKLHQSKFKHFKENVNLILKLIAVSQFSFRIPSLIQLLAAISYYFTLNKNQTLQSLLPELKDFIDWNNQGYLKQFEKDIEDLCICSQIQFAQEK